ncbi:HtaA domain-containing protein [Nocardioides marmotae]|nr:HtaA domain-containing protein [Nocardioides marmotae]QKE00071.1 HtaA domain-containing protein [Nocardioides marmotae]
MGVVMKWGVKSSFRHYILTSGSGKITAMGGADALEDGTFVFTGEDTSRPHDLRFCGDLRFSAHHGMLFVMVHDPWITRRDNDWDLSVTDVGHWPARTHRMVFARLGTPAVTESGLEFPEVRLTPEASLDFGGNYPAGTALDPIHVVDDMAEPSHPGPPRTPA